MAKKIAPNRRSMFGQISALILTILGIQNDSKKHPKICFGVQGSLGSFQGTLWEACWAHFGLNLKLSGPNFRALPPGPQATSFITPRA